MTVEEKVSEIVVYQAGLLKSEISEDAALSNLGIDDLEKIEIVLALEEEYKIEISDGELEEWKTVKDIINCVLGKIPDETVKKEGEESDGSNRR